MDTNNGRLDLAAIRSRLSGLQGREYWQSLEELADSEGIRGWLEREFPSQLGSWLDPLARRDFLKFMGASLALAGLAGCSAAAAPTDEKIVPYVHQPEELIPGKPLFYATAVPLAGYGLGVLVESHEGRPTKVEGNPQHPASLGATDVFAQASVLTLYDPDRSQVVKRTGLISSWDSFSNQVGAELILQQSHRGAGLRILTETLTSPTLASQIRGLLAKFPAAKWHQYEPAGRDGARAGARLAFGEPVATQYRLERAEVILALDADFLGSGPGWVRYARDFAARRRVQPEPGTMNRLYVVESTPSITGSMADHRLPLRPGEVEAFARAVARGLGVEAGVGSGPLAGPQGKWIGAVVRDLQRHRGQSLVVAGDQQPPVVHALAHAMNAALGNAGNTVVYTDPVEADPVDQMQSLRALVADMEAGLVDVLLILGGNPVYTAPADLHFGDRMAKVGLRIHLGLFEDETSALCHWHLPAAHPLESWSDVRAYDGTVTILQPLIAPLYSGRSAHEVLAELLGQPAPGHDIVQGYWKRQHPGADFQRFWRTALHDGIVAGTALPPRSVTLRQGFLPPPSGTSTPATGPSPGLEIQFRPDYTVFDGRYANNGWLQELPKPITKLTWDNAALLSPATAERLGLSYRVGWTGGEHGQVQAEVVELTYQGRTLRVPVWILPGHADDCVTLHLGYGRTQAGRVGTGTGFNAYALQTSEHPWGGPGLELKKTGEEYLLAGTQFHFRMEGRALLRSGTLAEYRKDPTFAKKMAPQTPPALTIYPGFPYQDYAWGMSIDLSACIGCNACIVACQAENNIPVVGKDQVSRGREMHWIRVDRYYAGDLTNPTMAHQPVPCQQCENAPCELVCPVGATNHSAEGLNDMVYNRCVGTRYCSNNCPYKVRRFNFYRFQDFETPSLKLQRNPNVTVRSRGVMEKCTYCVQRINAGKIHAEEQDRTVRDGEIQTACMQVCPTQAIIFGNINDPSSRVARLKAEPRDYPMLTGFLNTRPRTTYLARLRNVNPELETE
jgi:MoCo/4Fe-4S cofactor protein with predicted Tat translocation signal